MAVVAANLLVEMGMSLARMETDIASAKMMLTKFASTAGKILTGIGVGLSVGALAAFTKETSASIQAIERQAQTVGLSAQEFKRWEYAAKLADVQTTTLVRGIRQLDRQMYMAAQNTGRAQDVYRQLGITIKDSEGRLKGTETILLELADVFKKMPNDTTKTAFAMALFGRAGAEMIPVLNQGRTQLKAWLTEADKIRGVLSPELIARAEAVEQAWKKMDFWFQANRVQMFSGMSKALVQVADALSILATRSKLWEYIGQATGLALRVIVTSILGFTQIIYLAVAALEVLKTTWNGLMDDLVNQEPKTALGWWVKKFSDLLGIQKEGEISFKFKSAKPLNQIKEEMQDNIDAAWDATKKLWDFSDKTMPVIKTPPLKFKVPESQAQIEEWARFKAQFAQMLESMIADQGKYNDSLTEWDQKIVEINKRYDSYKFKLEQAAVMIPQHAGDIMRLMPVIDEYRNRVITLIREQENLANAIKATDLAIKSEEEELERRQHILSLQRPFLTQQESIRKEILNLKNQNEGYKILSESITGVTEKERKQAAAIADLISKNDRLIESLTSTANIQKDATAGTIVALTEMTSEWENQGTLMANFTKKTFQTMEDYLVDFIETGKFEFKDFVKAVLKDLTRLFIQLTILEPMAKKLKEALSGTSSQGGFDFSKMSGGGAFDFASGLWNSAVSKFDIWSLGGNASVLGMLHKGGIVGTTPIQPYIPRLHSGLAPNEFPAILEKGEIVLPKNTRVSENESSNESSPQQTVNVFISAIDALSFMELCKRNPGAILGPVEQALKGNSSIRYTIRETMR